jgi:adenosylcobinamide-GDP ribazoletransferase
MNGLKNQFLFALSFLTVFRVNVGKVTFSPEENIFARSTVFFPLVGAILGFFLATADGLFSLLFPLTVSSVIVLITNAFLTAGLHLDGFADTLDGLGAWLKGGKEKALEVMRDSRSGALGVLGLVLLILLKYSLLVDIAGSGRLPVLFLMPVTGRWLLVLVGKIYPYARSTLGLGQGFAGKISCREVTIASFWLLLFLVAGAMIGAIPSGAIIDFQLLKITCAGFLVACAGTLVFSFYFARCFGGMTGDILGAVNETGEVLFLLGIAVLKEF